MYRREVIYCTVGYVQKRSNILYTSRICTREKIHCTVYSSIRTEEKDYSAIVGYVQKRRNILFSRICS